MTWRATGRIPFATSISSTIDVWYVRFKTGKIVSPSGIAASNGHQRRSGHSYVGRHARLYSASLQSFAHTKAEGSKGVEADQE